MTKIMSDLVCLKQKTEKYGGMQIWTGVLSSIGEGHDWGLNGSETTNRAIVFKVFRLSSNSILNRSLIYRRLKVVLLCLKQVRGLDSCPAANHQALFLPTPRHPQVSGKTSRNGGAQVKEHKY